MYYWRNIVVNIIENFFHRLLKALGGKRLKQIIDGVFLERFNCVLIVSGSENYSRLTLDKFEHFKSVNFRHLNIEKNDIRIQFVHRFDAFETVFAFGGNLNVIKFSQIIFYYFAG